MGARADCKVAAAATLGAEAGEEADSPFVLSSSLHCLHTHAPFAILTVSASIVALEDDKVNDAIEFRRRKHQGHSVWLLEPLVQLLGYVSWQR